MSKTNSDADFRIVDAKLKYRPANDSVIWLEWIDTKGKLRTIIYQGKVVWGESKEAP